MYMFAKNSTMPGKTFAEKILGAPAGDIVLKKPDLILTHDTTANIAFEFRKIGAQKINDPKRMVLVLDHDHPDTLSQPAEDYKLVKEVVQEQGIEKFHDPGQGICHQIVSYYAEPGQVITGTGSHTCTAGAFNAFATHIAPEEITGLWKNESTWFRVPESVKINLKGKLRPYVYAKDLALWITGLLGKPGAEYLSLEFHGEGVSHLTISDRMTIANMASETGAKNAVFPCDRVLRDFFENDFTGVWADEDATYANEITIELSQIFPVVAVPHEVDQIKSVAEVNGIMINRAIIGTCSNGRIEDLRAAAKILEGKKISRDVSLYIVPASHLIYLLAEQEGLIHIFRKSGAQILPASCGTCTGMGTGIKSEGLNIISTANRNTSVLNGTTSMYLASPATVAMSAIEGYIASPGNISTKNKVPFQAKQIKPAKIENTAEKFVNGIWNFGDTDNIFASQLFENEHNNALTDKDEISTAYLFSKEILNKQQNITGIILAGNNFGLGRTTTDVMEKLKLMNIGLVIVKSVSRQFFRKAMNNGIQVIVNPEAVEWVQQHRNNKISMGKGVLTSGNKSFHFPALPAPGSSK